MKPPKINSIITCPHCKGKRGKWVLLYYWVKCWLCEGYGKMKILEVLRYDKKYKEVKAQFQLGDGWFGTWGVHYRTKIDWLF